MVMATPKKLTIKQQIMASHQLYKEEQAHYALKMDKYRKDLAQGNTKAEKPQYK